MDCQLRIILKKFVILMTQVSTYHRSCISFSLLGDFVSKKLCAAVQVLPLPNHADA